MVLRMWEKQSFFWNKNAWAERMLHSGCVTLVEPFVIIHPIVEIWIFFFLMMFSTRLLKEYTSYQADNGFTIKRGWGLRGLQEELQVTKGTAWEHSSFARRLGSHCQMQFCFIIYLHLSQYRKVHPVYPEALSSLWLQNSQGWEF